MTFLSELLGGSPTQGWWGMAAFGLVCVTLTLGVLNSFRLARLAWLCTKLFFTLGIRRGTAAISTASLLAVTGGMLYEGYSVQNGVENNIVVASKTTKPDEAKKAIFTAVERLNQKPALDAVVAPVTSLFGLDSNPFVRGEDKAALLDLENRLSTAYDEMTLKVMLDETAFGAWQAKFKESFVTNDPFGAPKAHVDQNVYKAKLIDYATVIIPVCVVLVTVLLMRRKKKPEASEVVKAQCCPAFDEGSKAVLERGHVSREAANTMFTSVFKDRLVALEKREADVLKRAADVKDAVTRADALVVQRQKNLDEATAIRTAADRDATAMRAELCKEHEEAVARSEELDARQTNVHRRENAVQDLTVELDEREADLKLREEQTIEREKIALARENDVARREFQVAVRERNSLVCDPSTPNGSYAGAPEAEGPSAAIGKSASRAIMQPPAARKWAEVRSGTRRQIMPQAALDALKQEATDKAPYSHQR